MRRLLCLALSALMFASCETTELSREDQTVTFGTFTIETTDTSATVTTTRPEAMLKGTVPVIVEDSSLYLVCHEASSTDEEWIYDFTTEGNNITFSLTELKPETEYRISLWYNAGARGFYNSDETAFYTKATEQEPEPEPEPDATELSYLSGLYFGNYYGATENDYNYSLALATAPNCYDIITGSVLVLDNSQYLFLDLYADTPAEEYNIRFRVPVGEYVIDTNNSAQAGTIGTGYSSLYTTNDLTGEELFLTSGTVTVTETSIKASITCSDGNEYHFICPTTEVDNSQNFGPSFFPPEQSTLEGDVAIVFADGSIITENYGDYYVIGKNCWLFYVIDNTSGDSLLFELLAPLADALPTGRFPVTNDLNEPQMALPGYVEAGETMWSWYNLYADYTSVTNSAPIADGEIAITDNGDGTITVDVNVVDDMEHKITGKCTAEHLSWNTRAELKSRK